MSNEQFDVFIAMLEEALYDVRKRIGGRYENSRREESASEI